MTKKIIIKKKIFLIEKKITSVQIKNIPQEQRVAMIMVKINKRGKKCVRLCCGVKPHLSLLLCWASTLSPECPLYRPLGPCLASESSLRTPLHGPLTRSLLKIFAFTHINRLRNVNHGQLLGQERKFEPLRRKQTFLGARTDLLHGASQPVGPQ